MPIVDSIKLTISLTVSGEIRSFSRFSRVEIFNKSFKNKDINADSGASATVVLWL
jgi:hypothetical protein